jgi:formylglycine-generating enzyme required for sulfatase activity
VATTPVLSQGLSARIELARQRTDRLFDLLKPDALHSRPIPERHRLIFYLGHLEAFDWNLFGIDPPVGKVPEDQPSDWPRANEILAYNQRVRARIDQVLEQVPEQIAHVAIEHRLMHAETLAYLLHNLPYDKKIAVANVARHSARQSASDMITIPAGRTTLGQKAGEFGWDNEFNEHQVDVPAFAIGKYKVTNGDYLELVKSGAPSPHFWKQRNGEWYYCGMFGEIPLPMNAPVYVTHTEASAYARWVGKSLPTEAQFHRAAYETPQGAGRPYPWGSTMPDATRGNFDFHQWDPADVDKNPSGDSAFGVSQLVGNGWEWTSTQFGPFPGFEPFPFYPGYSKNFFDEEHYVLKGASPRTDSCFLRRSFRNWFRPNYPYVYASFRLIEN